MRKLTRGNRDCEFTAQQLLPARGLSTHLPHGGCQELPAASCGDGNELPAGRSRDTDTAEPISQPHSTGRACTGNYGEMLHRELCWQILSAARAAVAGLEDALMHSSHTEHLMPLLHLREEE